MKKARVIVLCTCLVACLALLCSCGSKAISMADLGLSNDIDEGAQLQFTTACKNDTTKTTQGVIEINEYKTVESDDTHAAKDGYVWKILKVYVTFDDENAQEYGASFGNCAFVTTDVDALKGDLKTDSDNGMLMFDIKVNDEEKTGYFITSKNWTGWNDNVLNCIVTWEFLVPAGYTDIAACIYDAAVPYHDAKSITALIGEKADTTAYKTSQFHCFQLM